MKGFLSEKNVKFAYVDICASVGTLKSFLKIRDTSDVHAPMRESHRAGIPTLVVDDQVYLVDGLEDIQRLTQELNLIEE